MDTLSYKTVSVNKATANKGWVVIDANDEVLGRLASRVALILRGKNKPSFTPHADCGDNVIIINADKVRLTGKKLPTRFTSATPVTQVANALLLLRISLAESQLLLLKWL